MRAVSISVKPLIRVSEVLFLTIAFFICYNRFLVNNSLENLRFALNSIEKHEYQGLERLLSFNLASEVSKERIESEILAGVEYVSDTIPLSREGRPLDELTDILRKVVSKKAVERMGILSVLDAMNNTIAGALGLKPRLHARLRRGEEETRALLKERASLGSRLAFAKSKAERQDLLYRIGIIQMRTSKYKDAVLSFKETRELVPTDNLAARSLFNTAWCEKMLGSVEDSLNDFREFVERYPKDELVKDAEFQIAILHRKNRNYESSIETLSKLAEAHEKSALAPTALYMSASTYLYDLKDKASALDVLEELKRRYPVDELASAKTALHKKLVARHDRDAAIGIPKMLWAATPQAHQFTRMIEDAYMKFVIDMIEASIAQIETSRLGVGDKVKVEKTEGALSDYLNEKVIGSSKTGVVHVRGISIRYLEGNRVEVEGTIVMGGARSHLYVLGRLVLKVFKSKVGEPPRKWVTFNIEECRFGRISAPPEAINEALTRAHRILNEKLPYRLERCAIDIKNKLGTWEGTVRVPLGELRSEGSKTYKNIYKKR